MEGYKAKNVNNIIKPFRSQACNLYASQKLYNVRCDQLNPHGFTAHTHSY
ncbi:hypothetical protein NLO413_0646 [Candidatus Neoehrlichia lotoris str. RAC413]|uniref:Uncharacterized protein n=2 Tax=Candidatus Neoehrlichia procyonis TaxID=467750 RepID=A0A0F3NMH5_9RICK|nr:hypothetical protein NLO413_0646 [Candidatus Neoehrlichia lotoris str. RAC413]